MWWETKILKVEGFIHRHFEWENGLRKHTIWSKSLVYENSIVEAKDNISNQILEAWNNLGNQRVMYSETKDLGEGIQFLR